jgi:zona occludens toxin
VAFSAYCGSTGEGKTYEVVENVIVKSIGEGRRVLTNVTGLNVEKIHDYLRKQGLDDGGFGEIVQLPPIESCAGRFAVIDEASEFIDGEPVARLDEYASLIRGGDVVVLDEVWRIWKRGTKIEANDEKFWRMHRHILHPVTNVSTDIVLITQNWSDLNSTLRGLVHQRFVMKKHTSLGFSSKYSVNVFDIGARKPHIVYQRTYRPEIFALYKSHSMGSGAGKENTVDGRGNLLKRLLVTMLPLLIVAFGVGGFVIYKFFTQGDDAKKLAAAKKSAEKAASGQNATDEKVTLGQTTDKPDSLGNLAPQRVVGYIAGKNGIVLLIDVQGAGLRQVLAPDSTIVNGQYVELELDGRTLGTMSGELQQKAEGVHFGKR